MEERGEGDSPKGSLFWRAGSRDGLGSAPRGAPTCGRHRLPARLPPRGGHRGTRTGSRVLPCEDPTRDGCGLLVSTTRSESLPQTWRDLPRLASAGGEAGAGRLTPVPRPQAPWAGTPGLDPALHRLALCNLRICLSRKFSGSRARPLCGPRFTPKAKLLAELMPNQSWLGLVPPLGPWVTLGASVHLIL